MSVGGGVFVVGPGVNGISVLGDGVVCWTGTTSVTVLSIMVTTTMPFALVVVISVVIVVTTVVGVAVVVVTELVVVVAVVVVTDVVVSVVVVVVVEVEDVDPPGTVMNGGYGGR